MKNTKLCSKIILVLHTPLVFYFFFEYIIYSKREIYMIHAYKSHSGFFTYRHEIERARRRSENNAVSTRSVDRASERAGEQEGLVFRHRGCPLNRIAALTSSSVVPISLRSSLRYHHVSPPPPPRQPHHPFSYSLVLSLSLSPVCAKQHRPTSSLYNATVLYICSRRNILYLYSLRFPTSADISYILLAARHGSNNI